MVTLVISIFLVKTPTAPLMCLWLIHIWISQYWHHGVKELQKHIILFTDIEVTQFSPGVLYSGEEHGVSLFILDQEKSSDTWTHQRTEKWIQSNKSYLPAL